MVFKEILNGGNVQAVTCAITITFLHTVLQHTSYTRWYSVVVE